MDMDTAAATRPALRHPERFAPRHLGPNEAETEEMLQAIGHESLDALTDAIVPQDIRLGAALDLPEARSEREVLAYAARLAAKNDTFQSFIGLGYAGTLTPPVIQRNLFENPGWYTQYTPYQAEIAQGRLEMLLNFQTMVSDLTGLPVANASLLDEGTAAAEAMQMLFNAQRKPTRTRFFVSERCHPQTIAVVQMRAEPLGIAVEVGDHERFQPGDDCVGALVQYPATDGAVLDYKPFADKIHEAGGHVVAATDLLALALIEAPGAWADVAVGNSQRFGVPMGYGGPHAAFFATQESFLRKMPGRIIGVSRDAYGDRALRMTLQTREQHIRREKATSNICTAQALLANMAAAYAVYHGPGGIRAIALYVHQLTALLKKTLEKAGLEILMGDRPFFDTLRVRVADEQAVLERARSRKINLRQYYAEDGAGDGTVGVALDETATTFEIADLAYAFTGEETVVDEADCLPRPGGAPDAYSGPLARRTPYLEHPVFNTHHSESEMMRYLKMLENRDLSLVHAMIPLGSCTMKLNAAAEMIPVGYAGFSSLHPFAPKDQAAGYGQMLGELTDWLSEITGFHTVSLQPNSGAMGEYAGLLTIRAYHLSRGDADRLVCLIPASAHGTNPASAVMAGMEVVVVKSDENGNVDVADLRTKAEKHASRLAALMVTYPSTHGVFETAIREMADVVHENGGLVYMDGANMNAQVGLCRPGDFGMDVCHLNLHKTFAIPHGGGGPGMGPIGVTEALAPFLPGNPLIETGGRQAIGPVAAAPFGSASILLISWAYIAMMGADGLKKASQTAILNANYMAKRLDGHYDVLYRGEGGVAHEFILDVRPFQAAGVGAEDIAKRLMDYGYHAPTMSWPVAGTLMVEPTESEARAELDRFCDAMIAIRSEIQELEIGGADPDDNVLKNAPHPAHAVLADAWDHPYTREQAAYPAPWTREAKFWPTTGRVDNAFGDRNVVCACPPVESYASE